MKISYIVTVYNLEKYIKECLESVALNSAFGVSEIIIVDDGSTDGTSAICDEFAEKYDYVQVIHQKNGGLAHARNIGTCAANGEWLCFIDGDDYLLPGLFEAAEKYLNANKLDIVFFDNADGTDDGRFKTLDDATCELFQRFSVYASPVYKADPAFAHVHVTTQWAKFYRKQFLVQNNLLSKEDVILAQDIIFNLNVYAYKPRMAYINKRFYHHRILLDSCCHRYRPNYDKISSVFIDRMYEAIQTNYDNLPDMIEASYCGVLRLICNYLFLNACNEQNPFQREERERAFWELTEKYKTAIECCNADLLEEEHKQILKYIQNRDFLAIEKRIMKATRKKKQIAYLSGNAKWLLRMVVWIKHGVKRLF